MSTALACSHSSDSTTTAETTTASARHAGIGQEVRDSGFAYAVTDVTKVDTFDGAAPHGAWAVVSFTVKNIRKGSAAWNPETQILKDRQGSTFKPDKWLFVPPDFNSGDEIKPGDEVIAALAYDVPTDMQPDTIALSDSYGTATVDLGVAQ